MSDFEVQWIEALSTDRLKLESLAADLSVHPLAIEDCLNSNQRAKFEDFENHQFLVWFAYIEGEVYELEFVVFPHLVLMVTNGPAPREQSWREFFKISRFHRDANHMLYQALDRAMDASTQSLRPLFQAIEAFESDILQSSQNPANLLELKGKLSRAEFSLSALSSVVAQWQRFLNPKDDLRWRMRDLWDHCERTHQNMVFFRSQITSAMEMYWGVTAKRTNDQIKKLTLVASVSVPLAFWTSFFGMNFDFIPFHDHRIFFIAVAAMAASVGGVYYFLRRKGFWEK